MSPKPTRLTAIAACAIVYMISYVCFFYGGNNLGLVGPDEPRYAAIAREMAETGDWVTPRLQGTPWFEKPALYYWTAATSFKFFGVSEFAARMPSGLAAVLAVMGLAWLAAQSYGIRTAWALALMFPTSVGIFAFARAATTDMLFSGFLCLAMIASTQLLGGWKTELHPEGSTSCCNSLWSHIAWGGFLGVAVLAKGPAAIVLAGGSIAVWTLATRRWKDAFRLLHPIGAATFVIVAVPWYVLCSMRNPDFFRVFFVEHNLQRYSTPVFQHQQPWWYFVPILLAGVFPWTPLLAGIPQDLKTLRDRNGWAHSPGFYMACWIAFPFLFFSFSQSKLPGYILPAILPITFLLARSAVRRFESSTFSPRPQMVGSAILLAAFSILGLVVITSASSFSLSNLLTSASAGLSSLVSLRLALAICAFAAILAAFCAIFRRHWASLFLIGLTTSGMVLAACQLVLPLLDPQISSRAAAIAASKSPSFQDGPHAYELHRSWHYGLNFYLHRPVPEWSPGEPFPSLLLTSERGLGILQQRNVVFVVIARISKEAVIVRVEKGGA